MSFERMLSFPRSRAGWESLAEPLSAASWLSLVDLGEHLAATTDLKSMSARGLLDEGVGAGYLEKRRRRDRRVEYRVTQRGLDERVELGVR